MRAASDIADWWDEQHAISKKFLDEFVDDHPNMFGVVVATLGATAMELGAGTVDVLRLGEGAAEGTVGGVVKDGLRALSIVGTLGKGAKIIKEVVGRSAMMRLIVDPGGRAAALGGGGRCVYVSATQALRQTGQRAFASVDDLARELGMTIDDIGTSSGPQLRAFLLRMKVQLGAVLKLKTVKDLEKAVPHDGSVVSFGVSFVEGGGHRLYAFRDALGRVRIMDRGGRGGLPKVFETLEEVCARYRKTLGSFNESFVIKDLFLKFVGPKGLATLAMEVLATTLGDAQTTAQAFEAYKSDQTAAPAAPKPKAKPKTIVLAPITIKAGAPYPGGVYTVKRGDSLSRIAQKAYGDQMKYPVIYMANRKAVGPNPNLIHPGLQLNIPVLTTVPGIK